MHFQLQVVIIILLYMFVFANIPVQHYAMDNRQRDTRLKSSKFGHTFANSVHPDETAPYEPPHQDFYCLLSLFNIYSNHSKIKETGSLSEFRRLSEITRLYPNGSPAELHSN